MNTASNILSQVPYSYTLKTIGNGDLAGNMGSLGKMTRRPTDDEAEKMAELGLAVAVGTFTKTRRVIVENVGCYTVRYQYYSDQAGNPLGRRVIEDTY